jgi:hypothetical protein
MARKKPIARVRREGGLFIFPVMLGFCLSGEERASQLEPELIKKEEK